MSQALHPLHVLVVARLRGKLSILCLLAASPYAFSQASTSPAFPPNAEAELQAVMKAGLADNYAYAQLSHLTETIGARPSGSNAATAAVHYVADQMRAMGLEVHLEPIRVPHWVRGEEKAALIDYPGHVPGTEQKIVLTALRNSKSTGDQGLTAELLVVNDFEQLQALPDPVVRGKIVLFNVRMETAGAPSSFDAYRKVVRYRQEGPKAAAARGAVAALVRSLGTGDYRLPHTGDSEAAGIPAASLTEEDADLIVHLSHTGPVRMHLLLTPANLDSVTSYNVIADLRGSANPETFVIVSAHLDSWDLGTGATDDAAGIAISMAALHTIHELHLRPRQTIRFIAWMDEELDGSGSLQYAKDYAATLPSTFAAIEADEGASRPLGFQGTFSAAARRTLEPVQNVLRSVGASELRSAVHPPGTTDLDPLAQLGVPVIGLMDDGQHFFDFHHTAADTLDKIDARDLRQNVGAIATLAYALACSSDALLKAHE